jgi:hypothetical protein
MAKKYRATLTADERDEPARITATREALRGH